MKTNDPKSDLHVLTLRQVAEILTRRGTPTSARRVWQSKQRAIKKLRKALLEYNTKESS